MIEETKKVFLLRPMISFRLLVKQVVILLELTYIR